jgi:hypothetical protein
MDLELKKPELHEYSVANHLEFHKTSYIICDRNKTVINAIDLLSNYQLKIAQEESIFKWSRISDFTEKKAETDRYRDKTLSSMMAKLRADAKHFDTSIRDSARQVLNMLSIYGNLANADYNAETAGIDSIIAKLNTPDYLVAVQTLNLEPWLTELAKYNNIFKSYAADAEQEKVKKPDINPRTARRQTDEALRKIINRVSSLADLNGPGEYLPFATEFNVHVDVYNTVAKEHYGRLHAKTSIVGADIDPIATQPCTGKPVYVIPTVRVSKTEKDGTVTIVELRFSEDFSVGYKNNEAPGTATLIITGIGKYTGEIVTTFKISDER